MSPMSFFSRPATRFLARASTSCAPGGGLGAAPACVAMLVWML